MGNRGESGERSVEMQDLCADLLAHEPGRPDRPGIEEGEDLIPAGRELTVSQLGEPLRQPENYLLLY